MPLDEIADSYDDPQVKPNEWERFWLNRPVPLVEGPPSIFPTWPHLIREAEAPVAFAIAADVNVTRFVLGGGTATFVDVITPAAFEATGPQVPAADRAGFVAEVKRIAGSAPVGLQEKGPAWPLRAALDAAGVRVEPVTFEEFIQACDDFDKGVSAGTFGHSGQLELSLAVGSAQWRTTGERRVISRKTSDIPELEAVILARHVATTKTAFFGAWR
jgi:hypothetical protein